MDEKPKKVKATYIGAPAVFKLELACQHINAAFSSSGEGYSGCCYLVGSALEDRNWRDVDIRFIMNDTEFQKLFPQVDLANGTAIWEFDPRWLIITASISDWMRKQTDLPIDFQIQPQTFANARHDKPRSAMGLRIARSQGEPE